MKNFPTLIWKRLQNFKDAPALYHLTEKGECQEVSFWEWTRRIQNLAIALMELGVAPETRLGLVAPNSRDYLDLVVATWLVGGCVVPLSSGRDRRETLRCLGRVGAEWIFVPDEEERARLAGPGGQLPEHLKWIYQRGAPVGENRFSLEVMEEQGRTLARRGRTRELAERIFELTPKMPTVIFYDEHPDQDSQGAFFSGQKVAYQLEGIGHQMGLKEEGRESLLSALSFGWFSSFQMTMATLLSGNAVAIPTSMREISSEVETLRPTRLLVGPAFLEALGEDWARRVERAPEILKRLSSVVETTDSTLDKTLEALGSLGAIGDRAVRKFLYDPIRTEFGGKLRAIYVVNGQAPEGIHEILDKAGVALLGQFGIAETGLTHIEHLEAQRIGTVGRPLEGVASKIAGAKTGAVGELYLRGDFFFDGYWAGEGRRAFVDEWLPTGVCGHLEGGFFFLADDAA